MPLREEDGWVFFVFRDGRREEQERIGIFRGEKSQSQNPAIEFVLNDCAWGALRVTVFADIILMEALWRVNFMQ